MDNRSVEIIINARDMASATLGKISGELKSFGAGASQFLGSAVQAASRVAIAGLAGVGVAAFTSVKAFMESENAVTQLNAVLKSTKGVAGITAEAANGLASSLQKVTKFSDEAILGGENMLLTFTNIGKDVFPQATETMLDMSQALGQDLKASSVQLGKALQDPIKGVTALSRVGVNFSESQKEMIKSMVEAGDVAGAQKLILAELKTEFGGSARAAGETLAGKLEILKNQFGELQEKVGGFIASALVPLTTKMLEFVGKINLEQILDNIKKKFTEVTTVLKPFLDPLINFAKQHAEQIKQFFKTFAITLAVIIPLLAAVGLAIAVFSNPLVLIGLVVAGLIAIWQLFSTQIKAFYQSAILPLGRFLADMFMPSLEALANTIMTRLWPAIKQLWDALMPGLWTAIKVVGAVIGIIVVAAIWIFINVLNIVISVISWVIAALSNLIRWYGTYVATVINVVQNVIAWFSRIPQNVGAVVNSIAAWWAGVPNRIMSGISSLSGRIGSFFSGIGQGIVNGVSGGLNAAKGALQAGLNWMIDKANSAINAVNNVSSKVGLPKIPTIPRLATGSQFFQGGMAMVGENGPELVSMPRGSRVYNAQETQAMGNNTQATFYGDIKLGDASAVREFFDKIGRNQELAQQGLTTLRY